MKLFIVTCLKEYLADISKIFKQANIHIFSTSDIIGYKESKTGNLLADWFASGSEEADSMMIFTFTSEINTDQGIEFIKEYNESLKEKFPVRAFVLPVEKSI